DLYRALYMRGRLGESFEGTVTGLVGTGAFVQLDSPFVDVLVKMEDLGADRYQLDDDGLRIVGARSGDTVALGDRIRVTVTGVAIRRRSVYGRRVGAGAGASAGASAGGRAGAGDGDGASGTARAGAGGGGTGTASGKGGDRGRGRKSAKGGGRARG